MAKLTAYIHTEDARAQAAFYVQALGGEIKSVVTFENTPGIPEENRDKVMHLHMEAAGGNELFLTDSFEPVERRRSISLSLSYESESEARDAFAKLSEGGQVTFPFNPAPWGGYYGEIRDKFGIDWMIVSN